MTKLNKVALSLATAGMFTSAFAATGTMAVAGGSQSGVFTVASEQVAGGDQNLTASDVNITFTPSFLGSIQQGSLVYTFTAPVQNPADYRVCDVTNDITVTDLGQAGNGSQIILDLNGSVVVTGQNLLLVNVNAAGFDVASCATTLGLGNDVELEVAQGAASASVGVVLANSGATEISNGATTTMMAMSQAVTTTITKLDATIDAAAGFLAFTPDAADTFTMSYNVAVKDINNTFSTYTELTPDQNVSSFITVAVGNAGTQGADNNYSQTVAAAANPADSTVTFTKDGTSEILVSNFTANSVITYTKATANGVDATVALDNAADAGAWSIFGYSGKIPNVSYSAGLIDTTMSFTNRSSTDAGIYFTIIDAAGNTDVIDSVNDGLATMAAGTTNKYKMSDLIALTTGLTGGSFAVEVTIPTTPSSVYGFASFKNLNLGQFKDLPIYNNGTSY